MIELAVAINTLVTTYKTLKELANKVSDLEVKRLIVDLGGQIIDLQMAEKESQLKIAELESEIKRLTSLSEIKFTEKDGGLYDEETGQGPYCPNCYKNDKELRLMGEGVMTRYLCSKCHLQR